MVVRYAIKDRNNMQYLKDDGLTFTSDFLNAMKFSDLHKVIGYLETEIIHRDSVIIEEIYVRYEVKHRH